MCSVPLSPLRHTTAYEMLTTFDTSRKPFSQEFSNASQPQKTLKTVNPPWMNYATQRLFQYGVANRPIASPSLRMLSYPPPPSTSHQQGPLQYRPVISYVFQPRFNPTFILARSGQAAPAAKMWPLAEPPPLTLVHIAGTRGRGSSG